MTTDPKIALDYLESWLDRHRQEGEAVPVVQKAIDILKWQWKAIEQQPEDTKRIPLFDPSSGTNISYDDIPKLLPLPPKIDLGSITKINTFAASGASGTYENILRIGDIPGEINYKYYSDQTSSYQLLQVEHNRIYEVETMLRQYNFSNTLTIYPIAQKAYYSAKGNDDNITTAALEIRNLLEKFKGDLYLKAMRVTKENMTWEIMAERLCPRDKSFVGHAELIEQKAKHTDLTGPLSSKLKRREDKAPIHIDDLWTMTLDHMYIILKTIST